MRHFKPFKPQRAVFVVIVVVVLCWGLFVVRACACVCVCVCVCTRLLSGDFRVGGGGGCFLTHEEMKVFHQQGKVSQVLPVRRCSAGLIISLL